ncbi:hypothetical protein GCM10009676_08150 [Prauserella halophila]|uniref:Uncharacterized protein n=2 Tax=Prauserella halophila TaxID=185641 RepID=A0ABN1W2I4_9PSEU
MTPHPQPDPVETIAANVQGILDAAANADPIHLGVLDPYSNNTDIDGGGPKRFEPDEVGNPASGPGRSGRVRVEDDTDCVTGGHTRSDGTRTNQIWHCGEPDQPSENASSTSSIHRGKQDKQIPWITGKLPAPEEDALADILAHIDVGTKSSGSTAKKWGANFKNRSGYLPEAKGEHSPYHEYGVAPPPGTAGPGPLRVVRNSQSREVYYTWTHYGDSGSPSFVRVR